jgi:hypothetical protein
MDKDIQAVLTDEKTIITIQKKLPYLFILQNLRVQGQVKLGWKLDL